MENKNIFAEFLQTSGVYDSIAIGEENVFDLIEILKGNVKISVYCKECEHERVFTMKPIKYYFMTGPYDGEEIIMGFLEMKCLHCRICSFDQKMLTKKI